MSIGNPQAREKDVVIVLMARIDLSPDTVMFLDDHHSTNVAVTRYLHGQFMLGH